MKLIDLIQQPKRKKYKVPLLYQRPINLLELIQAKKGTYVNGIYIKNGNRRGEIDYTRYKFCSSCHVIKPKEMIYCDECHRRLRTKPTNKKSKYWEKELKYY